MHNMDPFAGCGPCEESLRRVLGRPRPRMLMAAINAALAPPVPPTDVAVVVVAAPSDPSAPPTASPPAPPPPLQLIVRQCSRDGVEGSARAFFGDWPSPTVVLCANRLAGDDDVEEALVHELVHAYDYVARGMDLTECPFLGCSEVRAAREAECHRMPFFCPEEHGTPWEAATAAATAATAAASSSSSSSSTVADGGAMARATATAASAAAATGAGETSSSGRAVAPAGSASSPPAAGASSSSSSSSSSSVSSPLRGLCAWWKRRCVRESAIGATANMFPRAGEATDCVDRVFDECYADQSPFLAYLEHVAGAAGARSGEVAAAAGADADEDAAAAAAAAATATAAAPTATAPAEEE